MTTNTATDEDRSLKQRHATMWALGDYTDVATEVIPTLGPVLVRACGVSEGQRVLDVAAGAGNAALPAARTGAAVWATDLTPELLDRGRAAAEAEGLDLSWQVADAEALPCRDGEYDVVMSCVGVMFAPHHEASAAELLRVCRPGGTIGLLSWTPAGFIGQMFATMKPYAAAPPPPGSQPPPLWGDVDHVRGLLGDGVSDLTASTASLEVDRFDDPAGFLDFFKAKYGPTIAAYKGLAGDEQRIAALDRELIELAGRFGRESDAGFVMDWEYLLVTATRA
ncbi:class I SAM-dependent methyltransferase [Nocardioides sp. LHG3406-4]|uniref:class I SAM-dependent methyltransferase n=1 Tax=Nocardioides sp. LHG3406-4 TaxID=2804575 RepID=UPI003CF6BF69